MQLAAKEGTKNIRRPLFVDADGVKNDFEAGVPPSWQDFGTMPTEGVFKCTYICSPEDRKFGVRAGLLQKYGHWKVAAKEKDVMWWSCLSETPEDVCEFMEYIMGNFSDVRAAFISLDGPEGSGLISYTEFVTGLKMLNFTKFAGEEENIRILNVFRYLDPGGEGSVSEAEWLVLEQLYEEMCMTLADFVKVLRRAVPTLDEEEFWRDVWGALDADGSGEISQAEWEEGVRHGLRFFGPCDAIFRFLDKDDDGKICYEEFKALARLDHAGRHGTHPSP